MFVKIIKIIYVIYVLVKYCKDFQVTICLVNNFQIHLVSLWREKISAYFRV